MQQRNHGTRGGSSPRLTRVRIPIPKGRDPFVNTPLLSLGCGADGEERFWISTWNSCVGCLAALVTESGKARMIRFGSARHGGFYSAAQEDANTLWLCGDLSRVLRLDLSTGRFEEFPTSAPSALVFQGMVLDQTTGKLFVAAFPYSTTHAFSFDFRRRQPVKVYRDISVDKYMRCSFPNGDGTYSCILHIPGETILRWDPVNETAEPFQFNPSLDSEKGSGGTTYSLISDDTGRRYIPGFGWFDPSARRIAQDGPKPLKEMTWFARRGREAWGCDAEGSGIRIGRWNLDSGAVADICEIPDAHLQNANLSQAGKIVAVNLYGEFFRFDGHTGALEISKRLPADSYGSVDCLRRIDKDRLLGTPFITQRFWEVNLRTKKGEDCGRAAPGTGEVLQTWKVGGKIYLAAYTGSELMEYDPRRTARFPENPRVVADAPGGMRPVAAADDGRALYYACSRHYGMLGCVLARYDTKTGMALYKTDPLPDQQIFSLAYDRATQSLVAGTTRHADCHSLPPTSKECFFARFDPRDLSVKAQAPAPPGTEVASVLGALGRGLLLCSCSGSFPEGTPWFVLDAARFTVPPLKEMQALPKTCRQILYTGRPGYFLLQIESRIELWDWRKGQCVAVPCRRFQGYRFEADGESIYLVYAKHIELLDGYLKQLR